MTTELPETAQTVHKMRSWQKGLLRMICASALIFCYLQGKALTLSRQIVRFQTIVMKDKLSGSLVRIFSLKYVLFKTFDSTALGHGLNKTEEQVLMIAWDHGEASMHFLSRKAGLEKGSLTTVVDSLEEAGLAARTRDEADRRSFIVKPTGAGSDLAKKIDALFDIHLEIILGRLSTEERAEFEQAANTFARLIPVLAGKE